MRNKFQTKLLNDEFLVLVKKSLKSMKITMKSSCHSRRIFLAALILNRNVKYDQILYIKVSTKVKSISFFLPEMDC